MTTHIVFQIYQNDKYSVGWRDIAWWDSGDFDAVMAQGLIEYYTTTDGSRNVRVIRRTIEVVDLDHLDNVQEG